MGLPLKHVEGVTRWDPVRRLYALDLSAQEMRAPSDGNVIGLPWWRFRRRRRHLQRRRGPGD